MTDPLPTAARLAAGDSASNLEEGDGIHVAPPRPIVRAVHDPTPTYGGSL
jgi:hypothetical protein